mgnify:CR=1 FL=1
MSPDSMSRLSVGTLLALAAIAGLLYLLGPVLMPFAVSAGLAYIGDPLVDRLERWRFKRLRLSRTAAVTLVFGVIFGLGTLGLVLLIPLLIDQVTTFIHALPDWLNWAQSRLAKLGVPVQMLDPENLRKLLMENWTQTGSSAAAVLKPLTKSGLALLGTLASLLLIPVVTFYLLRDWDALMSRIHALVPLRVRPTVESLARETDDVLGAFLRGQLLVMTFLAVFYSTGLLLAGLQLGLLIGLVAGLVSFVPYLGFIVGIVAASVAMLVQTQELFPLLWVGLVFGIGQVLESTVVTPWLVGDRIGLHPVAVIFAVMAGGQLFGFVGVLLALPAAAVIAVGLRHWQAQRPKHG